MKKQPPSFRKPLTREELERLTPDEILRLKLTEDEKNAVREINQARQHERIKSVAANRAEAARLISELHAAGFKVENISDLISRSERYEAAVPILLRHLVLPYSDSVKETIARVLAVPEPEVKRAWPTLVDEYRKAGQGWGIKSQGDTKRYKLGAKFGLACALAVAVTDETLEELIAIAKDRTQGESRVLLLAPLKKRRNKNPLAKRAIEELASDPDLGKEIASW